MFEDKNKNIVSSYLVLLRDGEVLLSRRFQTGYEDGKYSLPAGHVESGESFTDGMIREAHEEIGIDIVGKDLKVIHVMHRQCTPHEDERVDTFFVAEHYGGKIVNAEPGKCDDLSWFPLDALPVNTIPYIRSALESIHAGETYSEFGWHTK